MTGKKTGGRGAGMPNKVTRELRLTLKTIVAGELETVSNALAQLPPKARLELLIKLLPFCMPKVDSIGCNYDTSRGLDFVREA